MTINDPVAYWKLDETSGTSSADSSGNGATATWNTAPTWGAGQIGNAAIVAGGTHAAFTGPNLANSDFSIAAWVKSDLVAQYTFFSIGSTAANDQAIHLRIFANSIFRFGMFNDDLDSSTGVSANTYAHLIATFNSSTKAQAVYVNGSSAGSRTASSNFVGDTSGWLAGWIASTPEELSGALDEVRIYNRVLSAGDIAELFAFTGASQPSGSSDYYSVKAITQGVINGAQPHLLAYESPAARSFVRPAGESAFYDVDLYPRQRFRDQHDAYATRFVQQNPPPGSGGFSWHFDRAVYPKLRFRDQHETYPPRGNVPSPVTPVGWTTPYDSRLWNTWRRPRPELLVYDGQATNSFAFTQVPSGSVSFFDFDKYPALQFRHQHEGHPARGLVPTAATPQGWTAFYDVEAPQKSKAGLADHEAAEFTFFPPRPLWTDYYDAEVIRGKARDYIDAPTPAAQVVVATGWGSFFDRSALRPVLTQQHETYPASGLVPTAATPQGWWLPLDLARVKPVPTSLQQFDGYQHFIPPVAVNLGPLGWSMYWDRGRKPVLPDRMPFLFEQLYQTPTATTPQGWTHLLDTARVKVFPAHLQQYDGLQRLSFVPPFITLPGDWYDVRIIRSRARDYQVIDRPMFFPPPFPFDQIDVRVIRPRAFPYSVIDQQPTVVVPPSAYVLFPDLFRRPRPFPYVLWPEQRVAVLNTPAGTGGPTYFYDRRLLVAHRPIAEVVPFDGRGLPFVVVNLIIHHPGKSGLLTPQVLVATNYQPTLSGIKATTNLSGEVED